MSTNHAKEAVDHVSQALDSAKDDKDQAKALEKLQDEIKEDTKNMKPEEQKAYMAQVTKDLEARNQLPVLAVAFAGQLGGDLNKGDLNSEMRAASRAERGGDNSKQLDKAMLQYLVKNYDQGANLVEAHDEEWRTDSKISTSDISEQLKTFRTARDEQHRKESNQVGAEKTAQALLGGGDKSLFNFIDRENNDGRLTKKELQDYLNDARSSGSNSGHFSKEKQQVVENILKEWDNRDSGKWIRGGYKGDNAAWDSLSKQGLVEAAGKKTESEVTHQVKADVKMTAKAGEGYWQIAERNLGKDGNAHTADEIRTESERISRLNNGKAVTAGAEVKVGEELQPVAKPPVAKPPAPAEKASEMEVRKGDSYWTIANRILGEKATASEILAKTKELQDKNRDTKLVYNPRSPQTIHV
ncbi:MAG: hypothetical protein C0469_08965 [Cyanobacteria bacterium DS2.3.42]|nr:hypothetical protein [Cyanobacteria bacterium DS2.3.42]